MTGQTEKPSALTASPVSTCRRPWIGRGTDDNQRRRIARAVEHIGDGRECLDIEDLRSQRYQDELRSASRGDTCVGTLGRRVDDGEVDALVTSPVEDVRQAR